MTGEIFTMESALGIAQRALWITFEVSMPFLVGSLVVGVLISIIQAAMQLQEPTISFVPKLIALAILTVVLLPWLMTVMSEYTLDIFLHLKDFW